MGLRPGWKRGCQRARSSCSTDPRPACVRRTGDPRGPPAWLGVKWRWGCSAGRDPGPSAEPGSRHLGAVLGLREKPECAGGSWGTKSPPVFTPDPTRPFQAPGLWPQLSSAQSWTPESPSLGGEVGTRVRGDLLEQMGAGAQG